MRRREGGRGKEGLAVHDRATQGAGPSSRTTCTTATTLPSPKSRGGQGVSERGCPHHVTWGGLELRVGALLTP